MKAMFVSVVAALVLAACGGGGGGDAQVAKDTGPGSDFSCAPECWGPPASTSIGGNQQPAPGEPQLPGSPIVSTQGDASGVTVPGPGFAQGPTMEQPQPPGQAGAGAPPIWCHNADPATCPPGTTPTQPAQGSGNCGSMACPVGGSPTQPGTPEPARNPSKPDLRYATYEQVLDWNAANPADPIVLPERSGRSLNWWGTDPREIENAEDVCTAAGGSYAECAIPDGDKLVWNFSCEPQPSCRIRLSRYDY